MSIPMPEEIAPADFEVITSNNMDNNASSTFKLVEEDADFPVDQMEVEELEVIAYSYNPAND